MRATGESGRAAANSWPISVLARAKRRRQAPRCFSLNQTSRVPRAETWRAGVVTRPAWHGRSQQPAIAHRDATAPFVQPHDLAEPYRATMHGSAISLQICCDRILAAMICGRRGSLLRPGRRKDLGGGRGLGLTRVLAGPLGRVVEHLAYNLPPDPSVELRFTSTSVGTAS